jgi:hypothetical protein
MRGWKFVPGKRLCRNHENSPYVILNEVKNLDRSIRYRRRDPSVWPQDDIATRPLREEGLEPTHLVDVSLTILDKTLISIILEMWK